MMITSLWQLFPLAENRAAATLRETIVGLSINGSIGRGKTSGSARTVGTLLEGGEGGEK